MFGMIRRYLKGRARIIAKAQMKNTLKKVAKNIRDDKYSDDSAISNANTNSSIVTILPAANSIASIISFIFCISIFLSFLLFILTALFSHIFYFMSRF